PRWYVRLWAWIKSALRVLFQVAIFIAALTFLQRQEPTITPSIDHQTKALTIAGSGFAPLTVRVYAIRFEINYLLADEGSHIALNAQDPISAVYTHGFVLEGTTWLRPLAVDLRKSNLTFTTWPPETTAPPRQAGLYCLAIEARNLLSNQSVIEPVLTPEM